MNERYKKSIWLAPLNKISDVKAQIIFFPHAGGMATSFTSFSKFVREPIQLLSIELPGKGTRLNETPSIDFNHLIIQLCEELIQILSVPTIFFGHSMGALLAYECAKRIEKNYKHSICKLIVSGQGAPFYHEKMKYLNPHSSDTQLLTQLQKIGGISEEILKYPDLLSLILENVRSDCYLLDNYSYQFSEPLSCQLTCIMAEEDEVVDLKHYDKWHLETNATCQFIQIKGGHFALFNNKKEIPELINSLFS